MDHNCFHCGQECDCGKGDGTDCKLGYKAYMSVRESIGLLWDKQIGKIAEFSYYPPEIDE